jgi:hypothetical protein
MYRQLSRTGGGPCHVQVQTRAVPEALLIEKQFLIFQGIGALSRGQLAIKPDLNLSELCWMVGFSETDNSDYLHITAERKERKHVYPLEHISRCSVLSLLKT